MDKAIGMSQIDTISLEDFDEIHLGTPYNRRAQSVGFRTRLVPISDRGTTPPYIPTRNLFIMVEDADEARDPEVARRLREQLRVGAPSDWSWLE